MRCAAFPGSSPVYLQRYKKTSQRLVFLYLVRETGLVGGGAASHFVAPITPRFSSHLLGAPQQHTANHPLDALRCAAFPGSSPVHLQRYKKPRPLDEAFCIWCGKQDLNLHDLAITST